ncbi:MAG: hypothetical protein COA52_14685 [Hyphomicrobiales bacterium]|nr:MAG: hypothetical protein COA52_14685 [Hyphomicrobiales bacterium]
MLDISSLDDFHEFTTSDAFDFYESIRDQLPVAGFPANPIRLDNLGTLYDQFDVFVFDAYGVLNTGLVGIQGAAERIADLKQCGKQVFLLTNGASYNAKGTLEKFDNLGFNFQLNDIVPSRLAAERAMAARTGVKLWGVISGKLLQPDDLPANFIEIHDENTDCSNVNGFLLLSAVGITSGKINCLRKAMRETARPLLVANPDVVAPQNGPFSREPGFYSHRFAKEFNIKPEYYGKPFPVVFDIIHERIVGDVAPARIAMMGDTLHTDVLGAAAMGWKTVLVSDHGLFRGFDVDPFIKRSSIVPDYIVPSI